MGLVRRTGFATPTDPISCSANSLHKENKTHNSEADRMNRHDPGCSNTQPNTPSHQTRTDNNPPSQPNKRQKRNPIHFMELTKVPTDSLPNSPEPLQPSETAATKIWHHKHNNAAFYGNVKACNTIFKYDYQIREVLDWQQIANLIVTPTQLHRRNTKSNYNLLLLKNGHYTCSRAQG